MQALYWLQCESHLELYSAAGEKCHIIHFSICCSFSSVLYQRLMFLCFLRDAYMPVPPAYLLYLNQAFFALLLCSLFFCFYSNLQSPHVLNICACVFRWTISAVFIVVYFFFHLSIHMPGVKNAKQDSEGCCCFPRVKNQDPRSSHEDVGIYLQTHQWNIPSRLKPNAANTTNTRCILKENSRITQNLKGNNIPLFMLI